MTRLPPRTSMRTVAEAAQVPQRKTTSAPRALDLMELSEIIGPVGCLANCPSGRVGQHLAARGLAPLERSRQEALVAAAGLREVRLAPAAAPQRLADPRGDPRGGDPGCQIRGDRRDHRGLPLAGAAHDDDPARQL